MVSKWNFIIGHGMWDVVSPTYFKMCEGSINNGFFMEHIDVILINIITKNVKTYLLGG